MLRPPPETHPVSSTRAASGVEMDSSTDLEIPVPGRGSKKHPPAISEKLVKSSQLCVSSAVASRDRCHLCCCRLCHHYSHRQGSLSSDTYQALSLGGPQSPTSVNIARIRSSSVNRPRSLRRDATLKRLSARRWRMGIMRLALAY